MRTGSPSALTVLSLSGRSVHPVRPQIAEDDRVFVRSTMTGTNDGEYKGITPTGRNVAADCAEVFRLSGGKIVGHWCLMNVAGLMRQLTEGTGSRPV
jgi:predicted ester cyclase